MKTTHFSLILLPILVFFLANGLSTPQATVALPVVPSDSVDHFKIWDVDVQSANVPVNLKDQFYPEGRDGVVDSLTKFANPVRKIHEDTFHIIDPNAHLAIYNVTVEEDSLPSDIRVRMETQFDREEWLLGKARFLLVPTHKVEKGSSFPTNLDLISDGAKLMSIAYNRLNLPQEVTNPAGAMTFDYTFGGEKIR